MEIKRDRYINNCYQRFYYYLDSHNTTCRFYSHINKIYKDRENIKKTSCCEHEVKLKNHLSYQLKPTML